MPVSRKQLKTYLASKAANYHAGAGQTIAGNLARGEGGQFTSAGNASAGDKPASGGKKPSKAQELRAEQRAKRDADATQAKADRQAKREQDKADLAEAKAQEQEDNAIKISDALLGDDSEALGFALADPETIGDIKEPYRSNLVKRGLIKQEVDGSFSLTNQAKTFDRAARAGNPKKAKEALRQARLQQTKRDMLAKRIAERKARTKKKAVFVFKDFNGRWRWATFSSSGYQDRDGEYTSTKALAEDCDYCDSTGQYGDLLFWHEPMLKLGTCDFNAMHERILIESGGFVTEEIGEAFSRVTDELGVSLGFKHYEPGPKTLPGRVFKTIRKFERSILPLDSASNLLTKLFVSNTNNEVVMDAKKIGLLERLLGKKTVTSLVEQAEQVEKAAQGSGLGYKATTPTGTGEPEKIETKADGVEVDAEGMPIEVEEETDPELTNDDIVAEIVAGLHADLEALIGDKIGSALQPIAEILAAAGSTQTKEVNAIATALKETATVLKEMQASNKAAMQRITSLEGQIKALNGELPAVVSNRASQSAATVAPEELASQAAKAAGEVDQYAPFAAVTEWNKKNLAGPR